jgi:hypothetical protein
MPVLHFPRPRPLLFLPCHKRHLQNGWTSLTVQLRLNINAFYDINFLLCSGGAVGRGGRAREALKTISARHTHALSLSSSLFISLAFPLPLLLSLSLSLFLSLFLSQIVVGTEKILKWI